MDTFSRDIVTIGASSGGIEALLTIVKGLPQDLPASLFVVLHVAAHAPSRLPAILAHAGSLPAMHARDNEAFEPGRIYVAPPDAHLLLSGGRLRVIRGPKENNHRPAIDPMFRSAARVYGRRVIGIVLSGALDDGAAGLFAIKRRGGVAIVQEPQDALFPDMPLNARTATPVDYSAPKDEIAKLIINLADTTDPAKPGAAMANGDNLKQETDVVAMENSAIDDEDRPGTPSVYGCPDCGGTLWELQDDEWLRFRCRVGHAYSAEGLLNSQTTAMESALWNAFRALHENAALARRVAKRARDNNQIAVAEKLEQRSRQGDEEAELIRSLLLIGQPKSDAEPRME